MTTSTILLFVAVAAGAWGVVVSIFIFAALRRRGEDVSFLLLRLLLPAYVHRYAEATRSETGRPGKLFYQFVVAFNLALVAVLLAVFLLS